MNRYTFLKHFIALTVLSASLFMLDQTSILASVSGSVENGLARPVLSTSRGALHTVTSSFASILSIRSLATQIALTEKERDFFRGEYMRLNALSEENELLRQALQIESESQHLLIAQVVSFNSLLPRDLMQINKGELAGISVGDAIITENRVLVGIVAQTEPNQSTIRLVSSESSNIAAILAASGTHASLRGSATGALNLDLIPRETTVTQGELVVTSGVSGAVPSHLIIGDIQRIIDNETASFKRAVVRPLAQATQLKNVFVITSF